MFGMDFLHQNLCFKSFQGFIHIIVVTGGQQVAKSSVAGGNDCRNNGPRKVKKIEVVKKQLEIINTAVKDVKARL